MKKWKYGYDHTTAEGQKRLMYESMGRPYETKAIDLSKVGDFGSDPTGDGLFRMVPSGDIVDLQERNKRLGE